RADAHDRDYRSDLPDRTDGPDARVRIRRRGANRSLSLRARRGDRSGGRRHTASSAGHESVPEGVRGSAQSPARGSARWRGNDVSRISNEDKTMKSVLFGLIVAALCCLDVTAAQQNQNLNGVEVHVLPAQGNVYMLVGAGSNITVQVGSDGVLVVDAEFAPLSEKVLAAIRTLSKGPIRYLIN